MLDSSDLDKVHDTSLRVLEEVGVDFLDEEALKIFRASTGTTVEGSRVRFSRQIVEWAVNHAPSKFVLRARNPSYDICLGDGRVYYTSGFGATFVCDVEQRSYRKAVLDDVTDYVIIADKLENVHFVLTPFIPQDVAVEIAEIYVAAQMFICTEKHIAIGTPTSDYLDEIWEMGQLVSETTSVEGPLYSLGCTINSPLVYSDEMLPKVLHAAKRSIPLRLVSGLLAGAVAPVTLAGALALQNAEILAGVTLCQLANTGCPVIYGTFSGGMDMRTGKWGAAGPEMSLLISASAQLCKMYDIPLGYGTGGISDSRVPDVRAGFEKGMTNLSAALAGVEVIHDGVSGLLGGAMAISLEQFIIDNEIAKWVNHLVRGIPVNSDTLAFDVIKSVGPGGHFLEQEHTVRRFKEEHLIAPLMSREYELEWPASEDESMLSECRSRVHEILSGHRAPELDQNVKQGMQTILERIGGEREIV